MRKHRGRLTEPLVRENGTLRPASWDEALDRAAAGLLGPGPGATRSFGMFSCSKATNEVNFLAQKFARVGDGREQHRLAATAPDTLLASSVWRRCSVRAAARVPTERSRRRTHPPVGIERPRDASDLLPPRPEGRASTARGCTWSIRAVRARPSGPTAGSGSTSAPTSRSPTRWRARSSTPACVNHDVHRARDDRLRGVRGAASSRGRSSEGERETGVPAQTDPRAAHAYARADRAMICWTLGITEHHNAVDNVLCADQPRPADRARRPLRLGAQPAARPEQRAGRRRHGRDPEQAAGLPGHRGRSRGARAVRAAWGVTIPPKHGWHLTQMFEAMERGELRRST